MASANGGDSVPDTWDDTSGGNGDAGGDKSALKLNVNAPVFTPGQNVFAPAFVPVVPSAPDTTDSENAGKVFHF